MLHFSLNVGLFAGGSNDNSVGAQIARAEIVRASLDGVLSVAGTYIDVVKQSASEPTLVIRGVITREDRLSQYKFRLFLFRLSVALSQDCIAAVFEPHGKLPVGELIGPKADAWGPFNPDFFLN